MNKPYNIAISIFVVVIWASFFLPWVNVESQTVCTFTKLVIGRHVSIKTISGFQVPILANGSNAKLMITIIKEFNPAIVDVKNKSWLVWGIPGLAIFIFVLAFLFGENKWVNLGMGILALVIFVVAVYKIMSTNLEKMDLCIEIALGFWITLLSYLAIGIVSLFRFSKIQFTKSI